MNEEQIETFLAIARYGTFSRAAETLFLTQPTVSHRIRSLEQELNAALMIRTASTVRLTPAGTAFLAEAQRLSAAFQAAHRAMRPYAAAAPLRIGFPALMLSGENHGFRTVMRLTAPGAPLSAIVYDDPEAARRSLVSGDVDLIFTDTSLPCFADPSFGRMPLFTGGAYVCIHRGHRLSAQKQATLEDLRNETLLLYRDSTRFSSRMSDMLKELGAKMISTGLSFDDTAHMLRPDTGALITNVRLVEAEWLVYRPLALPEAWPVGVIWQKPQQSPRLLQLVERIAALPQEIWRK